MALKTFKPITPGLRQLVIVDRSELYKGKPVKKLTEGKSSSGGRNNHGRVTVRFRGGGHKQSYRIIDFKRRKLDVAAKVERIEYDPNRTSFIALIRYADGEQAYIIAPQRLGVGDEVIAGQQVDVKPGNAMPLASMPVGTIVHNVEMKIGKGAAHGALGRQLRASRRPRSGLCHCPPQFGRAAPGPWPVLRNGRRGVEPRPHECLARQGGSQALARTPSAQSRRHDEPGRSSARRRRRPHLGRPSSGHAVGQADKGQEDALQQIHRQIHRDFASQEQEEGLKSMARSISKGPFVDGYLLKKADAARASGRNEVIKIWSRRSTILPQFVGLTFGVYNGHKHIPVSVSEDMIGHKFGEFSPTRTFHGHAGDKKAKRA